MKSIYLLLLFALCNKFDFAQQVTVNGDNYLLLNGERFKNQKIIFTKAEGDWFVTAKDGHGTITMFSKYEGRDLRFDFEWDGKKEIYPVNNEIRHHVREGEFLITMPDKDVYSDGLNSYPSGEDEVSIRITKVDMLNVSGEINGIITEEDKKVKVSGAFNLKRNAAPKNIVNSSYKDCDNIVYDKLTNAEGRSPSECEAKFDLDVRTAIHEALVPAIDKFQNNGWEISEQTNLDPLTIAARGSEKNIFGTSYTLNLKVSPSSAVYNDYLIRSNELTEQIKQPSKESYEKYMKFGREMNSALNCNIYFSVNNHGFGFASFKSGTKVTRLAGNIYFIQSGYVQARTGGGEDESSDASFLLIGNWKQPVIRASGDGSEDVQANAVLNPSASHLQVQNIFIRIETNPVIANDFIKTLDIQKLQSMINR